MLSQVSSPAAVYGPLPDTRYIYTFSYQLIRIIQVIKTDSFHAKGYANYVLFDYEFVTLSLSSLQGGGEWYFRSSRLPRSTAVLQRVSHT